MVSTPKRPEIPVKDFAETVGVAPSLLIPFEPQLFGAAANNGQMLPEVQPRSQVAEGIRTLSELITGRTPSADSQKGAPSILSFLKGRKQA